MKKYKKTTNELFICEECGKICKNINWFGKHIKNEHKYKEYYDKWLKEKDEGLCKICGKETIFSNKFSIGYRLCCSKECAHSLNKESKLKISITLKRKFASKEIIPNMNGAHSNESRKKLSKTMTGRKLSNEHKENISKGLNDSILFKKSFNTERIIKTKKTNLKKYGVENVSQNFEIFKKQQINGFKLKYYENTDIYYRGSYELDFLKNFINNLPDITNTLSIKYKFNKRNTVYFPDFYIPSLNLIVEIKNSYLAEKDKDKIKAKQFATYDAGFNYIMIVNKDYTLFEKLLNK